MADQRFGPNSAEVEAFFDRLRRLTPADWEKVREATPSMGSVPVLEVHEAPQYFNAIKEATRIAKRGVFPGSESAYYDAMRTALLIADASRLPATAPEPAGAATADGVSMPPDLEAETIDQVIMTAYEEESRRRVMNASMVAAGALVLRRALTREDFARLYSPFAFQ